MNPDSQSPAFVEGQIVTYSNNGDPVEAVIAFVSALGLYVVRWPGHTCTARADELAAVEAKGSRGGNDATMAQTSHKGD